MIKVVEGQRYVLKCPLATEPFPPASITWFQGSVEKPEWRNSTTAAVKAEIGMHMVHFSCRVSNYCGTESRRFSFTVEGISFNISKTRLVTTFCCS